MNFSMTEMSKTPVGISAFFVFLLLFTLVQNIWTFWNRYISCRC